MKLKKIYFYLLERHKKKIVFLILFFTLVSVSIQVKVGLIDYGYFFVIFLSCYACIYSGAMEYLQKLYQSLNRVIMEKS